MHRLTFILLAMLLCACAGQTARTGTQERWTYIGNDPDGTQNIFMRAQTAERRGSTVTAWFKFEFISPRQVNGPDLKPITYISRHDLTQVDCKAQTLKLLDETYQDVEDRQVFHVTPEADGSTANRAFAGGVSDLIYEGACGDSLEWTALGEDPQQTQEIYALVQHQNVQDVIVKARFRFVYHDPRQMVAAPSLDTVTYQSRQASVLMDCGDQKFNLLHETYYDADGVTVFGVTPPKDSPPTAVAPDGITGIMYRAACGIPLDWTFLGNDPKNTQKVYLLGTPEKKSEDQVEARFRFEYLSPGTLTTPDLKRVQYVTRTSDVIIDCAGLTLTVHHESYLDAAGKEVFSISPLPGQAATLVAPDGISGMQQRAACRP